MILLFDENAQAAAAFAIQQKIYNKEFTFVSKKVFSGKITPDDDQNWYYAIGNYNAWADFKVKVWKHPNNVFHVAMISNYHLDKRYNWDVDSDKTASELGYEINHKQMGLLHQVGAAREFDIKGLYDSGIIRFNVENGKFTRKYRRGRV